LSSWKKKRKIQNRYKKNDKAMQERDKEPGGFSLKRDMLSSCQLITSTPFPIWLDNIYIYIYDVVIEMERTLINYYRLAHLLLLLCHQVK
jgi:hypothetical protein